MNIYINGQVSPANLVNSIIINITIDKIILPAKCGELLNIFFRREFETTYRQVFNSLNNNIKHLPILYQIGYSLIQQVPHLSILVKT
jgi:hypothetical protein